MSCFCQILEMIDSLDQIVFSNPASCLVNLSAKICCMLTSMTSSFVVANSKSHCPQSLLNQIMEIGLMPFDETWILLKNFVRHSWMVPELPTLCSGCFEGG